jgi:hypothetical protein
MPGAVRLSGAQNRDGVEPDLAEASVNMPELAFHDLASRHPGVTVGVSQSYSEAARVCLDRHHLSPTNFAVQHVEAQEAQARWEVSDERLKRGWANETDATEWGAYALALAAIELTTGMVAVSRAETRTGADYYIGASSDSADDLEVLYRVEVSGVDRGNESALATRLRQKIQQAAAGNSNLPAIAVVVGFAAKRIRVADVSIE